MKKGFIFSLDAALALMVVIGMGAMLAMHFQTVEPEIEAYYSSSIKARDSAVVGFYTGQDAVTLGLETNIDSDAEFGSCTVVYEAGEIELDGQRADLIERKYCEGT